MLLGNIRRETYSDYRTNLNAAHLISSLTTPLSASSTTARTPITSQQTPTTYARTSYRYTTATLLSLRPPTEITIFPDHLIERRFLDEENYVDLDRMLLEKAGKFDLESFNMHDGPIMPRRIHKYDFSDPIVIEKVKNRRPKDPLTPQQVAALTSVATRHQSSSTTFLNPHQVQSSHVWIDDYSHQQEQLNPSRYHLPPQPSMPYQRQNPNQCEIYTNQIKSLLPTYQSNDDTNTIPILQRLFQAQRIQQNEQEKVESTQIPDIRKSGYYQQGLSAFCTPSTPQQSQPNKSFECFFTSDQNQKDIFTQLINEHLKSSTLMQTPATPSSAINRSNKIISNDDDDENSFYSAPPSPTKQQDNSLNLLNKLENWFGTSIYANAYPCMPSDRVLSAYDLEQ